MDTILEKFYNGGNNSNPNNFLNSGFKTSPTMTTGLSPSSKSPLPVRPMISTINSTNINLTHKPNLTINTNYNNYTETKDFLKPQKLSFNSYSDLSYNNPEKIHRRYNSEYNIHNNTYADIKRNDTKMQMMEEKMKNLELKSQRLEVINDFFFDMFENNLVKEEINKQRENAAKLQKQKNKEEGLDSSSSSDSEYSGKKRRRKKNKKKNKNVKLNLNELDKEKKKKDEFDPQKYQDKTFQHTKDVLENIKKNVSNYLFEEELKKNEQLQIMGEEINELKSKLINQLEKMQMSQKQHMEKITFCLLNSGNGEMEDLALHLFRSGKTSGLNTAKGSNVTSSKNILINKKTSAFNSRKGSIHNETIKSSGTKEIPNSGTILKAVGRSVIPEVNEGEDEEKNK